MSSLHRRASRTVLVIAGLAALLTACSGAAPPAPPVAQPVAPPVAAPTQVPEPLPAIAVDWANADVATVTFADGRTLGPCEGGGLVLCVVDHEGRPAGLVELGRWPAAGDASDPDAWLRAEVDGFVRAQRADRETGCGPDYRFELLDEPVSREVDGLPALTYRYVGLRAGTELERGITTLVRRGDEVLGITAAAYDVSGCLAGDGAEFTPAGLETFEEAYDAIVRGSRLP